MSFSGGLTFHSCVAAAIIWVATKSTKLLVLEDDIDDVTKTQSGEVDKDVEKFSIAKTSKPVSYKYSDIGCEEQQSMETTTQEQLTNFHGTSTANQMHLQHTETPKELTEPILMKQCLTGVEAKELENQEPEHAKDTNSTKQQLIHLGKGLEQTEHQLINPETQTNTKIYIKNYHYWLIHINCLLFCFGQSLILTHIIAYGESVSLPANKAAALISGMGLSNIAGRILLGALASIKSINLIALFALCYTLAGVSVYLCTLWSEFAFLLSLMLVFGVVTAAYGPVLSEVCFRVAKAEHFASAYGWLLVAMGLGSLLGAPIAGTVNRRG